MHLHHNLRLRRDTTLLTDTHSDVSPSRTLADAPRADDGCYGPESMSWRVFSDPGSMLGAKNAVFLQT